jgi:hypothetical protein
MPTGPFALGGFRYYHWAGRAVHRLSVFFDELWSRQETSKSFNWWSLLDDIIVAL